VLAAADALGAESWSVACGYGPAPHRHIPTSPKHNGFPFPRCVRGGCIDSVHGSAPAAIVGAPTPSILAPADSEVLQSLFAPAARAPNLSVAVAVDVRDRARGFTPLHYAVASGAGQCVQMLLACGECSLHVPH